MILGIEKILAERQDKIRHLEVGQVGYTLPWMCVILQNGDVYLSNEAPLTPTIQGTSCLKVMYDGTEISLDFSDVYRFDSYAKTIEEKVSCIVGGKVEDWIKVGNITAEYKRQRIES